MAPTKIKDTAYLWVEFFLVIIFNLGVAFALLFFKSPRIQKLIYPIFISIFVTNTIFNRSGANVPLFYLFLFTFIFSLFPESNKSGEGRDISEQENDTIENNEDNHAGNDQEENSNNNQEENNQIQSNQADGNQPKDSNQKSQSFIESLSNINLITTFFVFYAWLEAANLGINSKNGWRSSHDSYHKYNQNYEVIINGLFYRVFTSATEQFIYAMLVLNDDPPRWLYLIYMIPLAILYPISSLLNYYVAKTSSYSAFSGYTSILTTLFIYFSFKMLHQFIKSCKEEGELKNKIINIVLYVVGFLWLSFVDGIRTMNNP